MNVPRVNLHIHSNFSDGRNTIKQIVEKAIKLNLNYICITDHFSNSWKSKVIPTLRDDEKIKKYLEEISYFQNYLSKTQLKLTLLKGIEIDLSSSQNYIIKLIEPTNFDLILFEYLESFEGISFTRNILDIWKKSKTDKSNFPIFGLAHFDPSYFLYGNLDTLINFLLENDFFFEFNSSYPQYYSRKNELFFEKIKDKKIMISVGCDSHHLSDLANIEEPFEMISYYHLKDNFDRFLKILDTRKNRI